MTTFVFIPGILTNPADRDGWTDRAVEYIQKFTPWRGIKLEYPSAFLANLWAGYRARAFAEHINKFIPQRDDLVIVAHSHGAKIVTLMLPLLGHNVAHVHLVAAACAANFKRNGLNGELRCYRLGLVTCYCSRKDSALRLARSFIGRWFGFGTLGLEGPLHVPASLRRQVATVWDDELEHNDWVNSRFHWLMERITRMAA